MSVAAVGCNMNKKNDSSTMPMHSAALDIPAGTPSALAPAPAGLYTPPQPVIADQQPQQPVLGKAAVADASESAYAAPAASPAPTRQRMTSSVASSSAHPAHA